MDYEPIARLGRGGMGVVDLARDAEGNKVAMKRLTLHGSASDIQRARQRLLREASVLRRLHHPNIVRLIEVVDDGDEIVLVMPYLSGGNLADRVAQHGPAPPADVWRLGQRLLGALADAHQAGIIHRDIKPANVLYDSEGEPMLADFGVAHTWDQTQGLTVAGMVVGTPGYMPPEQARDEQLTPASDIFSLGATLLFAATGHGPYGTGDPALLMVRSANDQVERLPKRLPKQLRIWLEPLLDPKPEHRPTAAALLTGQGLPPPRLSRLIRRHPVASVATVTALLVLLIFLLTSANRTDGGSGPGDRDGISETPGDVGSPTEGPSGDDGDGGDGSSGTGREGGGLPGDESGGGVPGETPSDSAVPPPEVPPGTDGFSGELLSSVQVDFAEPGERLAYTMPPMLGLGGECQGNVTVRERISLEPVAAGTVADLEVYGPEGDEPLYADTAGDDQLATVTVDQQVCPEPGEVMRVVVGLVRPDSPADVSEGAPDYVLSREEAG